MSTPVTDGCMHTCNMLQMLNYNDFTSCFTRVGASLTRNTNHMAVLVCMYAGAAAVKPAAARGLASLLRGCRRERPRTELYCRIMRELAWGRSCFARLAFIQVGGLQGLAGLS